MLILTEAHDFESYIHKIEAARMVLADYRERYSSGNVDIRELVISEPLRKSRATTRKPVSLRLPRGNSSAAA